MHSTALNRNLWRDPRTWGLLAAGTAAAGILGWAVGSAHRFAKAAVAGLLGCLACIFARDQVSELIHRCGMFLKDLGANQPLPEERTSAETTGRPTRKAGPPASQCVRDTSKLDPLAVKATQYWRDAGACDDTFRPQEAMKAARAEVRAGKLEQEVFDKLPEIDAGRFARNFAATMTPEEALKNGDLSREGYQQLNNTQAKAFVVEFGKKATLELARQHGLPRAVIRELRRYLVMEE
jgi:hypothetical protein